MVVWYGMVWYGMVWYGMVWHGMVWYGMAWYGMAWYDISTAFHVVDGVNAVQYVWGMVNLDLTKLRARAVPYLWPGFPVCQVVSTMQYVTDGVGLDL